MEERLASYLVDSDLITEEQLREAMQERRETGQRLVSVLNRLEMIPESKLLAQLSNLYKMEVVDLDYIIPEKEVLEMIPAEKVYHYEVLPIDRKGRYLTVAMVDPTDISAIEDLRFITSMEINPVLAAESSIREALDRYYTMEKGIAEVTAETTTGGAKELGIEDMEVLETEFQDEVEENKLRADAEGGPVIRLVNFYIADAVNRLASDIHIEPYEKEVRVRFRIDGVLQEEQSPPINLKAGIITRLKLMAKMNIAEHRLCQDGRINIQVGDKMIDLRVSVIPTLYGEKVVMRILDRSSLMLDLSKLGFAPAALKKFLKAIENPYGIVLVTGPTGSGKTTTLYSTLARLNKPKRQIMTVEDPVEYNLHGINQIQVHEEIGLTFVVRRICPKCKEKIKVSEKLLEDAGIPEGTFPDGIVYKGKGCSHCNQTGYKGRVGLYEVMPISPELRQMILKGASSDELARQAVKEGMATLREDGMEKIKQGVTTVDELMRETTAF
jgi:type IV pilus assembly protein PilB